MEDQTGAFLHELTHARLISKSNCVTDAARSRNSPQGLPEEIADAYELYAYARRAKRCEAEEDRNNPPPKQPGSGIYCWIKTKCKNGAACVGQNLQNAGLLIGGFVTSVGTCGAYSLVSE
ncbi:MAG: hypothetical protein M1812_006075 [Candelaria pacifica]|nr:MAG: hypothetical protein M1812_006075 [Candelaria pacifica]